MSYFVVAAGEPNGHVGSDPSMTEPLTGSLYRKPPPFDVVGSAESLVGRVLKEQGLGKYCDPDFVRYTSKEMQEALNMTQEEMDRAAHHLLQQEKHIQSTGYTDLLQEQET